MLQIRAVEGVGVQEDRDGLIERDAMFRGIGLRLPRIPLEHQFSIYVTLTRFDSDVSKFTCAGP